MFIIQGKELAKSYGVEIIFSDVSFAIMEGEKVGLVGPNGAGKTTLFRCLTGEEQPDKGEITFGNNYRIGYLEQTHNFAEHISLMDFVLEGFAEIFQMRDELRQLEKEMAENSGCRLEKLMERYSLLTQQYELADGFGCEAQARKVIKGLGFGDGDLVRKVANFSGGEKTRAGLARLLVREPDLLLLDEPTNHLDLKAVEWLEWYLKNYKGAVFIISHDRYFLNSIVGRILELENHKLESYMGNYSKYLVQKKERELAQARAFNKQQKEVQKIEEYILRYKAGIKSKQARGRASQLQRMERLENVKGEERIKLNYVNSGTTGDIVLRANNLSISFNGHQLFRELHFSIYQGEKVALIGENGTGKSSILKILTGELVSRTGEVFFGARVKAGYFDQEHKNLNDNYRVVDELMFTFNYTEGEARNKLSQILFQGDDVFKLVSDLSGGERGRLSLLKTILQKPNFLILDEPTNHLDIPSREVVEEFLDEFNGTMLIVSHDRFLLDRITDRTLELEDSKLSNYLGNYSYYREKKEDITKQKEFRGKTPPPKSAKEDTRNKINKVKLREQIAALELEIQDMEKYLQQLSSDLAKSETYQDEENSRNKVAKYKEAEGNLPHLYEKWEELTLLLEDNM